MISTVAQLVGCKKVFSTPCFLFLTFIILLKYQECYVFKYYEKFPEKAMYLEYVTLNGYADSKVVMQ